MVQLGKVPQVLASLATTIGAFSLGIVLGWTSPALPFLSNCNDNFGPYNSNFKNCTLPRAFTNEQKQVGLVHYLALVVYSQAS